MQTEAWHRAWAFWLLDEWRMRVNEDLIEYSAWMDLNPHSLSSEELASGQRYLMNLQKLSIAMWERAFLAINPTTTAPYVRSWSN